MDLEAEQQLEAQVIVQAVSRETRIDLEAVEFFIRSHMLKAGARSLEGLIAAIGRGRRNEPLMCAHRHPPTRMRSKGQDHKTILTILGPVTFRRSVFVCPTCGARRYPGDEILGVVGSGFSPGARRMMARAGAQESFRLAAEDLRLYAALPVDAKDVERVAHRVGRAVADWMQRQGTAAAVAGGRGAPIENLYVSYDATGVPMRRKALEGVRGKGPDGKARHREVKLGCVFTQTTTDEQGRPVRDPDSTTYVGAIESSAEFGYRIYDEAARRGLKRAARVIVLIDAQEYNKTIAAEHFPGAILIIDLYHAREHLAQFVRNATCLPVGGAVHRQWQDLLDAGDIEALTRHMRAALPRRGPRRKLGWGEINYFLNNQAFMRYDQFRAMGLFVGSGVIEAGCKTVIAKRLKQSGMFWMPDGANAITALRCCILSGRFGDFWEAAA
mgnify:CR=1 FL=1